MFPRPIALGDKYRLVGNGLTSKYLNSNILHRCESAHSLGLHSIIKTQLMLINNPTHRNGQINAYGEMYGEICLRKNKRNCGNKHFLLFLHYFQKHSTGSLYWEVVRHSKFFYMVFNPFPNKPWVLCVCSTSHLKTLGKGSIAPNKQFSPPPLMFYTYLDNFLSFSTNSKLSSVNSQFGRV